MSDFKVTGKLEKFLDVESGTSAKGEWQKQGFIVKTKDEYNNLYCFNVFGQEKVEKLTKYNKVGDEVTVSFNVNCREYQEKYYTDLGAWRIEKDEQGEHIEEQKTRAQDMQQAQKETSPGDDDLSESDDLPF